MREKKTDRSLEAEIESLRLRLAEAEDTIRAIRHREVDAFVLDGSEGPQVFTLQGAEQPYRVFIESMNEGALTVSSDGMIVHCNTRFAEMLGKPLHRIMGESLCSFVAPDGREEFGNAIKASGPGGFKGEVLLAAPDKKPMPLYFSVTPLTEKMETFCMVVTDLTELKEAEERLKKANEELESRVRERTAELRRSEEKYRGLFNHMNEGMTVDELLFDDQGNAVDWRILDVNPAAVANLGKPLHDLVSRRMTDVFGENAPGPFLGPFAHVVRTGESVRFEVCFEPAGRHLLVSAFHLGGPRLATLAADITERKRVEEGLRESDRRQRELLESLPHLVWTCGPDGRVNYLSRQWLDYTGAVEKDSLDFGWIDLVHPEDRSAAMEAWDEALAAEKPCNVETRLRRRDGAYRWFSTSAIPIRDEHGKVVKWLGSNTDIDDRKHAEMELMKLRDQLELRVKERTRELKNAYESLKAETKERKLLEDQLRQSQKMEALGTLTGGIAHDFNNILAAILGFAEMCMEDAPQGSLLEKNLSYIVKSSFRAKDLIKQMLTFSRKAEYDMKPLHLTPLIKDTLRMLRASIPATVEIGLNASTETDTVLANETGIQQVIMNLCTNAAHAMGETGGALTITISDADILPGPEHAELLPGPYVRIRVKDTGTGMTSGVMKRIFEPFYTTKPPGQGTGMGLAVVYGIVKSFKGDITVESKRGQGSTFQALIPKVFADEASAAPETGEVSRGKESILFVDDEELLAELGKSMLERLGYRVTAMTDSAAALNAFLEEPARFDLIITDQTMPGFTGTGLAREIFRVRPRMPVILCTGFSESTNAETVKAAGIRMLLMKPLTRRELGEAVRKTLDGKDEK